MARLTKCATLAVVISADAWRESHLPLPIGDLRPLLLTTTDREFRNTFGNAFLVRSLSPDAASDEKTGNITVAAIQPNALVRSTRSSQWVHMLARTKRSTFNNLVSIGRTRNNDVVVGHATVSRFHAFVIEANGGLALYDAGSRHGSFVDGQRAPAQGAGQPLALRSCTVVRFGSVEMTYFDAAGLLANMQ